MIQVTPSFNFYQKLMSMFSHLIYVDRENSVPWIKLQLISLSLDWVQLMSLFSNWAPHSFFWSESWPYASIIFVDKRRLMLRSVEAIGPSTAQIGFFFILLQWPTVRATAPGFVRMVQSCQGATAYTCLPVRIPHGRATDSGWGLEEPQMSVNVPHSSKRHTFGTLKRIQCLSFKTTFWNPSPQWNPSIRSWESLGSNRLWG